MTKKAGGEDVTKDNETATTPRASVGRERRLALALRALLDQDDVDGVTDKGTILSAEADAHAVLKEFGYESLESIPLRVALLNDQITKAVADGDGKELARLGIELDRARRGLEPLVVKAGSKDE